MESDPIALTSVVTLPAQPTNGTLFYVPLGGDGYKSPFAAHALSNMNITGDASGGSVQFTVNFDPKFVTLVSYLTMQIVQGTVADADIRATLASDETAVIDASVVTAMAALTSGVAISRTWTPHATLLPGGVRGSRCTFQATNVLADTYHLDLWAYLFNIRVREVTPIAPLLWAQGGSS